MKLISYKTVKEFWAENKSLLLEREALSQLIITNVKQNLEEYTSKECLFGVVHDNSNVVILVFCNVAPFNLLIYTSADGTDKESIHIVADYLIKENITIRGITGNRAVVDIFNEYYSKRGGLQLEEHFSMDIMEIRKVKENKIVKGNFRKATLADLELLVKWHMLSTLEMDNTELRYEEVKLRIEREIRRGDVFIYENQEHIPVSTASGIRKLHRGIAIARVYTPRDQRCKGYSTACMDGLSRYYLDHGNEYCTLFVEKKNPSSNRVYKKVGYVVLEDNYDYRIK
jgi:predicted GNAT family acetyltransferase